jgi:hypothetical protein
MRSSGAFETRGWSEIDEPKSLQHGEHVPKEPECEGEVLRSTRRQGPVEASCTIDDVVMQSGFCNTLVDRFTQLDISLAILPIFILIWRQLANQEGVLALGLREKMTCTRLPCDHVLNMAH